VLARCCRALPPAKGEPGMPPAGRALLLVLLLPPPPAAGG
jgi:hypothetical protein